MKTVIGVCFLVCGLVAFGCTTKSTETKGVHEPIILSNAKLLADWFCRDTLRLELKHDVCPESQITRLSRLLEDSWELVERTHDIPSPELVHDRCNRVIAILKTGDLAWIGDMQSLNGVTFVQVFYRSNDNARVWPVSSFKKECVSFTIFRNENRTSSTSIGGSVVEFYSLVNLGILPLSVDHEFTISLFNRGPVPLDIASARSSCSCATLLNNNTRCEVGQRFDLPIRIKDQTRASVTALVSLLLTGANINLGPSSNSNGQEIRIKLLASHWEVATPTVQQIDFGVVSPSNKMKRIVEISETASDRFQLVTVEHTGFYAQIETKETLNSDGLTTYFFELDALEAADLSNENGELRISTTSRLRPTINIPTKFTKKMLFEISPSFLSVGVVSIGSEREFDLTIICESPIDSVSLAVSDESSTKIVATKLESFGGRLVLVSAFQKLGIYEDTFEIVILSNGKKHVGVFSVSGQVVERRE